MMGSSGEFFWFHLWHSSLLLLFLPSDSSHSFVHIHRMSFTDWCKFFTEADVCRLINTSVISVHKTWHEVVHFGSWTKNAEPLLNRCGGCANHKQTFLQNPQVPQTPVTSCVHAQVNIHVDSVWTCFSVHVRCYEGGRRGPDLSATEGLKDPPKSRSRRKSEHRLRRLPGNTANHNLLIV